MTNSTFETPEEAATSPQDAGVVVDGQDTPEADPVAVPSEPVDQAGVTEERTDTGDAADVQEDPESDDDEDESDEDEDESDEDEDESDEDEDDESDDPADAEAAADGVSGDDAKQGGGSGGASRLEMEGDIAADYLEELLDIADLDGDIDTYVEGGRAHVSIVTEGDQLVGKNGEVLEALQELARLAVMTETDHRSRLMLDVAGHRERRRVELTALAKDAIADVKQTGEPARLAPMNPFERKIIHDIVAEAGLVSESEGVEPRRRVVILP